MLVSGDVTKLVGEDLRVTDEVADSAVGMTEDPIVDIGAFDEVCQVSDEGSVNATAGKLI